MEESVARLRATGSEKGLRLRGIRESEHRTFILPVRGKTLGEVWKMRNGIRSGVFPAFPDAEGVKLRTAALRFGSQERPLPASESLSAIQ